MIGLVGSDVLKTRGIDAGNIPTNAGQAIMFRATPIIVTIGGKSHSQLPKEGTASFISQGKSARNEHSEESMLEILFSS